MIRSLHAFALLACLSTLLGLQASEAARIEAIPYLTAKDTALRLSPQAPLQFVEKRQVLESEAAIFVDQTKTFQTLIGIGGALTDSAAEVFDQLPEASQEELLSAYFDLQTGIGYTLARTPIGSCDFSSETHAYVQEGDRELKTFSLRHDEAHRIPFIKRAFASAREPLKLFVSPWSPPGWMKDTGSALQGGKLKPSCRSAWAKHFVSFIRAYEAAGIPVWGLTVQNEPMAKQTWESCIYTAEEERDFIRDYLGPVLTEAGLGDKKLIAWDHNRDLVYQRACVILNDPEAARYVWGIGFHWYETWTGGDMQFENLRRVKEAFPDKALIFTEGCVEKFDPARLEDWALGERYGHSMINDFNAGTAAWTDWNILLDKKGGPNHVGNYCFAPIHGDLETGKLIYTNSYYYLGHFSKFIRPGAKRIISSSSRSALQCCAFRNIDGSLAVIVMNAGDAAIDYFLCLEGVAARQKSLPHSIVTILVR